MLRLAVDPVAVNDTVLAENAAEVPEYTNVSLNRVIPFTETV